MNILSQHQSAAGFSASLPNKTTKSSFFYVNDIHGQVPKMMRLVTAGNQAEIAANEKGSDFFRFCSGDTFIGSDEKRNLCGATFLNTAGIHAEAPGNHEFDITASICGNLLKNSNTHILGMNLNFPDNNSELSKKVLRSVIMQGDKTGERYGIIGTQPSDMPARIKDNSILEGITIDDKDQTIVELKEEVKKLQDQGINKIILLSHEGNQVEREIAQAVSGIDIIHGGHSHDLIKGVTEGENLLYSPSGEPVIITQAGRDGNNFGILNVEWDENGLVKKVQNNVIDTNTYSPNMVMSKQVDAILGESPVIGKLTNVDKLPANIMIEENPWADFVSDSIKDALDADIVLINSANFRGSVDTGVITERDISSIFPFANKLAKVKLNEKDLVDAIKHCGQSLNAKNFKPGIMQVSGLSYKLDKTGNLLELTYTDKQGQKRPIDVNNPDASKVYTAVYDEFLLGGGDKCEMLKKEKDSPDIIERYDFDKDRPTIDRIKAIGPEFEVKKDNRIQIV